MDVERINLVFNCEDKMIFSYRFIQAYSERIFQDSFIRYTFYVNEMPTMDLDTVPAA